MFLAKLDIKEGSFTDYEEEGTLGQGSYGLVLKVRRNKDGKYFAMKIVTWNDYSIDSYDTQFALKCAKNEVDILSNIKHKHIIGFEDAFIDTKK